MKKIITTDLAPAPIGPYNQAILVNDTFLYTSGQIGMNPNTNEWVNESISAETHQVMQNLKAILAEAGMDFSNVVKASIFIRDMHQFAKINDVYASYFDAATAPARETVEVANLPKFVNIEISVIAVK